MRADMTIIDGPVRARVTRLSTMGTAKKFATLDLEQFDGRDRITFYLPEKLADAAEAFAKAIEDANAALAVEGANDD